MTACRKDPVYGAMVDTRWHCYGHLPHLAMFWVLLSSKGKPVGALSSVMGDCIFSCTLPEYFEEGAEFLSLIPCGKLLADRPFVEMVCQRLGKEGYFSPTMICETGGTFSPRIHIRQEGFRPVYDFICSGYPYFAQHSEYESWLSSLSMRKNRGYASVYVLEEAGEILVCGIVGYRGETSGEIGSIVTAPHARGNGLGREMVSHLTAVLADEKRTAFLHLAEEGLIPFYQSAGFTLAGQWGTLQE